MKQGPDREIHIGILPSQGPFLVQKPWHGQGDDLERFCVVYYDNCVTTSLPLVSFARHLSLI